MIAYIKFRFRHSLPDTDEKDIMSSILSDGKILVEIDEHTWEQIIAQSEVSTRTQAELIKLTFDNFARNEVWPQFTNIARSYTKIIEGLYYSLDYYFFWKSTTKLYYQKLILNNKKFFIEALKQTKDAYVDIRQEEVQTRKKEDEKEYLWSIPSSQWFTDKARIKEYRKNIIQPSYVNFDSEWEQVFIEEYLEKSPLVQFWYKNGTKSEQFFAIPYVDDLWEKQSFYPDFIVYFTSWVIGIFDPKSGFTLKEWTLRAQWLKKYTEEQAQKGQKVIGGLLEIRTSSKSDYVSMLINNVWEYSLKNRENFSVFDDEYIQNYSFENMRGVSEEYISNIQKELEQYEKNLSSNESEYEDFIFEQKNAWDFDYEKRSILLSEINMIKECIREKEKMIRQFW